MSPRMIDTYPFDDASTFLCWVLSSYNNGGRWVCGLDLDVDEKWGMWVWFGLGWGSQFKLDDSIEIVWEVDFDWFLFSSSSPSFLYSHSSSCRYPGEFILIRPHYLISSTSPTLVQTETHVRNSLGQMIPTPSIIFIPLSREHHYAF